MAIIEPTQPAVAAAVVGDDRSYVDWPAILGGVVLATAISFVLLTFGSAIGLSMASAEPGEAASLFWFAIVGALWLLWVQISSFLAGGYLTGRLRRRHGDATESESDVRDGSHGLIMWGVGVLLGAFIAFMGVSGTMSAAGSAVGAAGTAVGAGAEAIDPFGRNSVLVDRALRGGDTPTGALRSEVGRVLATTLGDGEIDEADRAYLVSIIAERAGIEEAEAQERLDQIVAQGREIEEEARDAAEAARQFTMIAAFLAAASLFVSAAAAYFGATLGGRHRDEQTVFVDWSRRW